MDGTQGAPGPPGPSGPQGSSGTQGPPVRPLIVVVATELTITLLFSRVPVELKEDPVPPDLKEVRGH